VGKLASDLLAPVGLELARPASFVAFDVLAVGSVDVRPMRWMVRRRRLESLAGRWVNSVGVGGCRQLVCAPAGLVRSGSGGSHVDDTCCR
jgi:hypothetical protein